MHTKTTVRNRFSLKKVAKIEKTVIPRTEEDKEKQVPHTLLEGVYTAITFLKGREQKS